MKHLPIHIVLFSIYPGLALAAYNISEADPILALRPVIISILIGLFLFVLARWLLKDWLKAASVTVLGLALLYSYGHVYQFLESHPLGGLNFGRHRFLIVIFGVLFLTGIWLLVWKLKDHTYLTQLLNMVSIVLIAMPMLQLALFFLKRPDNTPVASYAELNAILQPASMQDLPDVYYIILDTYTREDALRDDFNFDNTAFLDNLRQLGFYVADCSRPNYGSTKSSLTATMNMAYIPEQSGNPDLPSEGLEETLPPLKNNRVSQNLEAIGYQTVAFETGYAWSNMNDADIFLKIGNDPLDLQRLSPFEAMFLKTTAFSILADSSSKLLASKLYDINFPYEEDINRQLFILDQLPRIASLPGAKFVFAHITLTHVPFIFAPDGSIRTDSGFFSAENDHPVDRQHLIEGYTGEIQYMNSRILPILREIINTSKTPPIIVMMGDHGVRSANRFQILNTYYLPDNGKERLYSTITPVNSFRVIFDTYFGSDYGLITDQTYKDGVLYPETSSDCLP